jgi:hypothetical protein
MKKFLERKPVILLLAIAGLVSLIYLAAGLRNVQFQPAEPLGFNLNPAPEGGLLAVPVLDAPMWIYLLCGTIFLVTFFLVLIVLDPKMRKRVGWGAFRFLISMALLAWVMKNYAKNHDLSQLLNGSPAAAPAPGAASSLGPGYVPPEVSPWLIFGLSFVVAMIVLAVGWLLYRRWQKREPFHTLVEIAGIARRAIDDLADGRDWDDAIVQCYVRMNQVATSQRGLIRQVGTTPSEFAVRMERAGLPGEAVRVLTRLYEQVRYGGNSSSSEDRNLAVTALNAILRACGEIP